MKSVLIFIFVTLNEPILTLLTTTTGPGTTAGVTILAFLRMARGGGDWTDQHYPIDGSLSELGRLTFEEGSTTFLDLVRVEGPEISR